jgi:hypothetical protein
MFIDNPIPILMCSYHRPRDFEACLTSILDNTRVPHKITILDNSCGGLDEQLSWAECNGCRIIKSEENIGKGDIFKKYAEKLIEGSQFFVSIDADIKVPEMNGDDWLTILIRDSIRVDDFAVLAPMYRRHFNPDPPQAQLENNLIMHVRNGLRETVPGVYYNRSTAGCLYLIDTEFYIKSGGYPGEKIFASDDGHLCHQAAIMRKFVGFTSNLIVRHLEHDITVGYSNWKMRNVDPGVNEKGYWD